MLAEGANLIRLFGLAWDASRLDSELLRGGLVLKRRPYDPLNVEFNDYNPYRTSGEFKPREDSDLIVQDRARPDEVQLLMQNPITYQTDPNAAQLVSPLADIGMLKACFSADTLVLTPNGYKPICEFAIGDEVYSRHELNPSGEAVVVRIDKVFRRMGNIFEVYLNGHKIETTREHPFHVFDRGWTPAGELKIGDRLLGLTSTPITVTDLKATSRIEHVFNIRVPITHTYFVGGEQWGFDTWTHNTYGGPIGNSGRASIWRPWSIAIEFAETELGIPLPSLISQLDWGTLGLDGEDTQQADNTRHFSTLDPFDQNVIIAAKLLSEGKFPSSAALEIERKILLENEGYRKTEAEWKQLKFESLDKVLAAERDEKYRPRFTETRHNDPLFLGNMLGQMAFKFNTKDWNEKQPHRFRSGNSTIFIDSVDAEGMTVIRVYKQDWKMGLFGKKHVDVHEWNDADLLGVIIIDHYSFTSPFEFMRERFKPNAKSGFASGALTSAENESYRLAEKLQREGEKFGILQISGESGHGEPAYVGLSARVTQAQNDLRFRMQLDEVQLAQWLAEEQREADEQAEIRRQIDAEIERELALMESLDEALQNAADGDTVVKGEPIDTTWGEYIPVIGGSVESFRKIATGFTSLWNLDEEIDIARQKAELQLKLAQDVSRLVDPDVERNAKEGKVGASFAAVSEGFIELYATVATNRVFSVTPVSGPTKFAPTKNPGEKMGILKRVRLLVAKKSLQYLENRKNWFPKAAVRKQISKKFYGLLKEFKQAGGKFKFEDLGAKGPRGHFHYDYDAKSYIITLNSNSEKHFDFGTVYHELVHFQGMSKRIDGAVARGGSKKSILAMHNDNLQRSTEELRVLREMINDGWELELPHFRSRADRRMWRGNYEKQYIEEIGLTWYSRFEREW